MADRRKKRMTDEQLTEKFKGLGDAITTMTAGVEKKVEAMRVGFETRLARMENSVLAAAASSTAPASTATTPLEKAKAQVEWIKELRKEEAADTALSHNLLKSIRLGGLGEYARFEEAYKEHQRSSAGMAELPAPNTDLMLSAIAVLAARKCESTDAKLKAAEKSVEREEKKVQGSTAFDEELSKEGKVAAAGVTGGVVTAATAVVCGATGGIAAGVGLIIAVAAAVGTYLYETSQEAEAAKT